MENDLMREKPALFDYAFVGSYPAGISWTPTHTHQQKKEHLRIR